MNEWFEAEQHVERAHELFEAGRLDEAEVELRAALACQPDQGEWHFNLGLTLEAAGRFESAIEAFESSWSLQSGDANSALMIGSCLMQLEDPAGALIWVDRAIEANPRDIEPIVYRVEALSRLGRHDEAEVAFYLGQQIDADRADLYVALADSLLDRGQHERAVWCLREASRLDPKLPKINARLAEAYAATGRHERARQLYLSELRNDPGDTDVLLDLGDLLVDMHRFDEASEKFRRVLELQPHHTGAHEALGELAARRGDDQGAVRAFDVVLRLDSEYPGVRTRLADCLLRRGEPGDAARARTLLVAELAARKSERTDDAAAQPTPEEAFELGSLFVDAERPELAIPLLRQAASAKPHNAEYQHVLSVALLRSGNLVDGLERARRALTLSPSMFAPMHNLALGCLEQRQWLRAWYWVRRARKIDADDAGLRRLRLKLRVRWAGELLLWSGRAVLGMLQRVGGVISRPTRPSWVEPVKTIHSDNEISDKGH